LTSLVLGPRWSESGVIVQFLLAGAVFQISGYVFYWAFLSTGRTALLFWCELPARGAMTILIILGAMLGPVGAAIGYSIGLALVWLSVLLFGVPRIGWRRYDMVRGAVRPAILYLSSFAVALPARFVSASSGHGPGVVLAVAYGAVALCIALFMLMPSYRRDMSELFRLITAFRRGRG
jgi:PST family polysaccharide transporter